MYGRISDPSVEPYAPRDLLALYKNISQSAIGWWGWGFHTVRGGIDPGKLPFHTRVVEFKDLRKEF